MLLHFPLVCVQGCKNAHAGSRTRVTSMGGLYDAATLRALVAEVFSFECDAHAMRASRANVSSLSGVGLSGCWLLLMFCVVNEDGVISHLVL